jgi:hypothetical protein
MYFNRQYILKNDSAVSVFKHRFMMSCGSGGKSQHILNLVIMWGCFVSVNTPAVLRTEKDLSVVSDMGLGGL